MAGEAPGYPEVPVGRKGHGHAFDYMNMSSKCSSHPAVWLNVSTSAQEAAYDSGSLPTRRAALLLDALCIRKAFPPWLHAAPPAPGTAGGVSQPAKGRVRRPAGQAGHRSAKAARPAATGKEPVLPALSMIWMARMTCMACTTCMACSVCGAGLPGQRPAGPCKGFWRGAAS